MKHSREVNIEMGFAADGKAANAVGGADLYVWRRGADLTGDKADEINRLILPPHFHPIAPVFRRFDEVAPFLMVIFHPGGRGFF